MIKMIELMLLELSFIMMIGLMYIVLVCIALSIAWFVERIPYAFYVVRNRFGGVAMISEMDFEHCWETGQYEDQTCDFCPHKEECSGSGYDDED